MPSSTKRVSSWFRTVLVALIIGLGLGWFLRDVQQSSPGASSQVLSDEGDAAGQMPPDLGPGDLQEKPNIILITVDTLRADRLGAYGYDRETSPWVDRLASRGVLLEQAFGGSSWTVPSMASIFTGLYPFQHRVDRGLVVQGEITHQPVLGSTHETLAEQLKAEGYTTFGVATNRHLSTHQGFAQGFDYFVNEGFLSARFVHEVLVHWAPVLNESEPYFLWLHFFDPHDRYQVRRPWIRVFDEQSAASLPELANESAQDWNHRMRKWSGKLMEEIRRDDESRDPVALATLNALYDAEIRYTDKWLARAMKAIKLRPDTVIVYTSDHGEEFNDHGDFGHRTTLYNEQVTVPLIISAPGRLPAGQRLERPVTLIDLAPTLVEFATGKAPESRINGSSSLLPTLKGDVPGQARPMLMSTRRKGEHLLGMVDDGLKLIHNRKQQITELYDLNADWGELHDLAATRPAEVTALLNKMRQMRKDLPKYQEQSTSETLSADTLEHLRGLGYVDDAGEH